MTQTKEGARKAVESTLARYGKDFYRTIGRKGGRSGNTGGFHANPALARIAGRKGGLISRKKVKNYHLYQDGDKVGDYTCGELMERFGCSANLLLNRARTGVPLEGYTITRD